MNKKKPFLPSEGNLEGSIKDSQSITADGQSIKTPISGVKVKKIANVIKSSGWLTEIFRQEWFDAPMKIDQIFQVVLNPGAVSGWHSHQFTEDRLFVTAGLMKIVLFDGRTGSPTYRQINEFGCGSEHPMLISVPTGVWHAVQNISNERSIILNFTDTAYDYEHPDHWRLPINTDQIPYTFSSSSKPGEL